MSLDSLIRETMSDWAEEAQVPDGFAERVTPRSRRRRLSTTVSAGLAGLVTAALLVVVSLGSPQPAPDGDALAGLDIKADPDSALPERLIAAGQMAVPAYFVTRYDKAGKWRVKVRTWYLADPRTERYHKTPWAYLDVAPGLRMAAVLEGPLPAARVGLVNLATGKVTRWFRLAHRAAGLRWSPDGTRLLVTHYRGNPDKEEDTPEGQNPKGDPSPDSRLGFSVVDVRSGPSAFRLAPRQGPDDFIGRNDFRWDPDGRRVWVDSAASKPKIFYALSGQKLTKTTTGSGSAWQNPDQLAYPGPSPSGRYLWRADTGPDGENSRSAIAEVATGHAVKNLSGVQPVVWADDAHLVVLESHANGIRYVLVGVGLKKAVVLSGFQSMRNGLNQTWTPLFIRR